LIVAKVDTSNLSRRLKGMRDGADSAALQVAKQGADMFVGFMNQHAPRDTGRYLAGWIEAGNAANVGPTRMAPALRDSRWAEKLEAALDRQIDRLVVQINAKAGVLDAWYFSKNRPIDSWARKKQFEIARLSRALQRAVETKKKYLNAEGPVIAFDIFSNGRRVRTASGSMKQLRQTTIRDKVYGGTGEIVQRDTGPVVMLHNREPHVTLVERKHRLITRANAAVRLDTEARGKRVFLQELSRAGR
jgi:hypothetical protein